MQAKNAHGIHSPFVFEFINEVLNDKRTFYQLEEVEKIRHKMYQDSTVLQVEDFGAGSHLQNKKERTVCDIARTAGRNKKFGELLFKMVLHYKPHHIVELGTSMGLGTMYLALANSGSEVHTIEGGTEIAMQAGKHFEAMGLQNIKQYIGNFDEILVDVLKEVGVVDLLFVDGNHRKQPTLNYFEWAKPFLHSNSIVIFDDIHWSEEMHDAWEQIKKDEFVKFSIDLFFFGIVFFREDFKEKQDFILK